MPELATTTAAPGTATSVPPTSASRRGQALVLAALLASGAYLVWRWGFTLEGSALWLAIPLVLAETYALAMLALLAFSCWRLAERTTPPPLGGRRVAVLIATFDEDEDVLRPTVVGALAIRNDVAPEVWVLDDGGREWVREMAGSLGARYLSRPAPRTHAKAGNINHALAHVDAEFLVTLDADHVPRPELLERMLGHMADARVAVVQAPQSFYNRGFGHPRAHEDPLRNEQSLFFDVICRGKDRHGAAFWCGCPSILRRKAIMEVGGVATTTVVEDAHTSMGLNARGWRVVYHHEVMALGLAPEEISAFVVQRGRWARGSLQILRLDMPLLKRGLTWSQRIEYMASCLHFLEGPQRLIGFLVPPVVLATGAVPISAHPLAYLALFLPQFVLVPLSAKALARNQYTLLEGERYAIVRLEAYLRALAALPRGRGGGFKVTPKGARSGRASVGRVLRVPIALALLSLGAVGYQTAAQLVDLPGRLAPGISSVTSLWAFLNTALIAYVVVWTRGVQHRRRSHRFPVVIHAAYSAADEEAATRAVIITDLSRHGARLSLDSACEPGERLRLVLLLDEGPVEITASIATVVRSKTAGGFSVGVDFDDLDEVTTDALVSWCFRQPFGASAEPRLPDTVDMPDATGPRRQPTPASRALAAAETAAAVEPAAYTDSGVEDSSPPDDGQPGRPS